MTCPYNKYCPVDYNLDNKACKECAIRIKAQGKDDVEYLKNMFGMNDENNK